MRAYAFKHTDSDWSPECRWVAICVDEWLAAQGPTEELAKEALRITLAGHDALRALHGYSDRIPAPDDLWESYEASDRKFKLDPADCAWRWVPPPQQGESDD